MVLDFSVCVISLFIIHELCPDKMFIQRIHNKHVLVTGASAGIGAATVSLRIHIASLAPQLILSFQAILFAKGGANVSLVARRADKLEEVKKEALAAHKEGGTGKGDFIINNYRHYIKAYSVLFANKGGKIATYAIDISSITAIDGLIPQLHQSGLPPVDILGIPLYRRHSIIILQFVL